MSKNRKLNWGLVLFSVLITILAGGCSIREEAVINEQPTVKEQSTVKEQLTVKEQPTVNEQVQKEDEKDSNGGKNENRGVISNNGGFYVCYNDTVYYRQYTSESYASEGIFGTYEINSGSVKDMIAMTNGEKQVAFKDTGDGPIYIYKDKMYLQKYNEEYIPIIYAVDLDGGNEQIIGEGWIEGINQETGIFICTLADSDNEYKLFRLDGATGEKEKYELETSCWEVLALEDGVIYYQGMVEMSASTLGAVKLCRVNVDGSNEKLLAETKADLYEYDDRGTVIPTIQFVDDCIYFSYGAYGGTGNFYQGGNIVKVGTDGSNHQIMVGENETGPIASDVFYVAKRENEEILYYSKIYDNLNFALVVSSGNVEETEFVPHKANKPFVYEDGVWIYSNGNPEMTELIPYIDYSTLGVDGDYYTIEDVELCDNWVYYKIQANEEEPEASIGWRDGYHRLKTQVIRQELDGEKKEILFEY